MSKYKTKTVIKEAEQFDGTYDCFLNLVNHFGFRSGPFINGEFDIKTLEGDMRVSKNDWVIEGLNGEHYPCKPDIFEKTYEAVESSLEESL